MKLSKMFLLVAALLLVTGCRSEATLSNGKTYPCVGLGNDSRRDSTVVYDLSVRNMVVGIVFFEMIVPPIVVVAKKLYCPVGIK